MSSAFGPLALLHSSLRRLARALPSARGGAGKGPQVSVLIPAFNHERYLGAALDSALGQSLRPREILVLDDGSTDGTLAVAQRYARRHPEVTALHRENRGAHATLNELLAAARSPLVAVLNSDDLWHPSRLARCAAALEGAQEQAVATGAVTIGPDGACIPDPWLDDALAWHARHGDLAAGLAYGNFVLTTSNLVARREALLRLGGFDALRYTHDQELLLRLLSSGEGLRLLPAKLLAYRLHPANTIKERPAQVRAEWAAILAVHARRAGRSAALDAAIADRGLGAEVEAAAEVLAALPADARASAVVSRETRPLPWPP